MSGEWVIRRADSSDAEAVLPLATGMATTFPVEPKRFRHTFDELMGRDDALVLLAESQGKVVGYLLGFDHLSFYANGRVSYVEELAVSGDRQREGIGRRLMAAFEAWSVWRSSRLVTVATRRAGAFYGAIGYEETATLYRKVF